MAISKTVFGDQVARKAAVPVRRIVSPSRDAKTGLFLQSRIVGPDRETQENHHRMGFANHFKFADQYTGNTRTYDEEGRYNCGRCNMVYEGDKCLLVRIKKVDVNAGSCGDWENQCAGDPELKLIEKEIPSAGYGIAANGIGYGCRVCPYASAAYQPDSRGRDLYCGKGDFRTFQSACCGLNGAQQTGGGPDGDYSQLALPDRDGDDD